MRRTASNLASPLPRHAIKRFHLDSGYNTNELTTASTNGSLDSTVYQPHITANMPGNFTNANENHCDRKYKP
jgi:hypothetical protein